jgi:hypothetical protein
MTGHQTPHRVVRLRVGLLAAVIVRLVSGRVVTLERPAPASSPSFRSTQAATPIGTRVRFELVASRRNGATGSPRTEVTDNVAVDDLVEHTLSAGTPTSPDLCEIGALAAPDLSQAFYLWHVSARVRSVVMTQTRLDVGWRRIGHGGQANDSEDDAQTITLEPGEVRLLDFVRDRTGVSPCASVQLQVRADPLPRPGVQPTLAYDVWLVHEGRGEPRILHQSLTAPSGRAVSLDLEPLTWSADGRPDDVAGSSPHVTLKVRGTLAATLRADGTLDVSVLARRAVAWGEHEVRGEGQEDFRGALGETVSLLLPNARGRAAGVDLGSLFAGTRTSVYVRVVRRD